MSFFRPDSSLVYDVIASPNHGERAAGRRPDMIVLHYTGMQDAQEALLRLCSDGSGVSSHYVVMEDGRIVQCVPESRRAWHAGESYWAGETDINSCSIGVEIVNAGHDFGYPDFPKRQVAAVIALCRGIVVRRGIPPQRVLAHSDVAPSRKMDPGEKFPWAALHRSRVGHWVEPVPILPGPDFSLGDHGEIIELFQQQLFAYGYFVPVHGHFDVVTQDAVMAFQRHFRTEQVDGVMDSSTIMTLNALVQSVPDWVPPAAPPTPPPMRTTPAVEIADRKAEDAAVPAMAAVAAAAAPAVAEEALKKIDPLEFAAKLAAELAAEFKLKDIPEAPLPAAPPVPGQAEEPPAEDEAVAAEPQPEFDLGHTEADIAAEIAELMAAAARERPDARSDWDAAPPPADEVEDLFDEIEPGTEVLVFEPKPKARPRDT